MNNKYSGIGSILMALGIMIGCSHATLFSGTVGDFVTAAIPWVLLGTGVAFIIAGIAK